MKDTRGHDQLKTGSFLSGCVCFKAEISPENECDFSAQDDTKKMCGDLCKLEGKMQSSDFLDFVMSEVISSCINILCYSFDTFIIIIINHCIYFTASVMV